VAIGSFFFILVVGLLTLARMLKRDEVTDEHKRALDQIRDRFMPSDEPALERAWYRPFAGRRSPKLEAKLVTSNIADTKALRDAWRAGWAVAQATPPW